MPMATKRIAMTMPKDMPLSAAWRLDSDYIPTKFGKFLLILDNKILTIIVFFDILKLFTKSMFYYSKSFYNFN